MVPALPVVRAVTDLRARVGDWRAAGETIALAPTMGALHEGHLSLVRLAKARADRCVASVFVNPAQFGPGEDFAAYPRDEARDAALLAGAGCDLLWAPEVDEVYPPGFATSVEVAGVAGPLEGERRPGHFAGVATVVAKLFNQVRPDLAVFGEKDYQQLLVIRRMTRDLDLAVEIVAAPIVRARDGLALSSRNAYLSPREREIAAQLNRMLTDAAAALRAGEPPAAVEARASQRLLDAGFSGVDYVEARGAETLERLGAGPAPPPARLLAAAWIGKTRLIDNRAV